MGLRRCAGATCFTTRKPNDGSHHITQLHASPSSVTKMQCGPDERPLTANWNSELGARSSGCATLVDITYCSVQRLLTYSRPSTGYGTASSPAPRARALCPVLASLRCQGQQTQCVPLMGHLPSGCRTKITVLSWRRGDVNHKSSYLIGYAGLNGVLECG